MHPQSTACSSGNASMPTISMRALGCQRASRTVREARFPADPGDGRMAISAPGLGEQA